MRVYHRIYSMHAVDGWWIPDGCGEDGHTHLNQKPTPAWHVDNSRRHETYTTHPHTPQTASWRWRSWRRAGPTCWTPRRASWWRGATPRAGPSPSSTPSTPSRRSSRPSWRRSTRRCGTASSRGTMAQRRPRWGWGKRTGTGTGTAMRGGRRRGPGRRCRVRCGVGVDGRIDGCLGVWCVCVCVCVHTPTNTHTYTHPHQNRGRGAFPPHGAATARGADADRGERPGHGAVPRGAGNAAPGLPPGRF